MKIIATWTRRDRGFGIGLLVGALTVGTALPHLLRSFGDLDQWKLVLYLAALLAALGALLAAFFVREGPYQMPAPRFNWSYIGRIMSTRDLVLANIGYLGHMWELYAMWTWIPVYLAASYDKAGISSGWAPPTAFGVIAIGGAGSILAGKLADQLGRTTITIGSLLISGTSALVVGLLFGASPLILVPVVLIWGFAIVADSAQFSACVSELSEREYIGTALTLQTSMGFLLTLASIRLIPTFENWVGWSWAFAFLAIGPVFGIVAMLKLRHSASALRLAGGNR